VVNLIDYSDIDKMMDVNNEECYNHCVFYCSKSKTIHGGTPVQTHVYKHYKGFVYFNYTYRLLFIALFDDLNLIISIFHCLRRSFYLSNLLRKKLKE
jgi:hypothetical protein